MNSEAATSLVQLLYSHYLGREPKRPEFLHWVDLLLSDQLDIPQIKYRFENSEEYKSRSNRRLSTKPFFPDGHFHSPVVDPESVRDYVDRERQSGLEQLGGIDLDLAGMRTLWSKNLDFITKTPFRDEPDPANRYAYLAGPFPYGDAITLRMLLREYRPRNVIEIGSGCSSACMLDTADEIGLDTLQLTCIDPDASRLRSMLRPTDSDRVRIIERPVQEVGPEIVDALHPGDLLFIDSTHVMKTGSDVHYEFFHLLPRIRTGVHVHFHDIMFPFEYPGDWIFNRNFSWNEAYVLRAFLMFNSSFSVTFWNGAYAGHFTEEIRREYPVFLKNPGGSIYLLRHG